MKLDEITKIKLVDNENEVNELLAKGYHIIKIYSVKETSENNESIRPQFILGLMSSV